MFLPKDQDSPILMTVCIDRKSKLLAAISQKQIEQSLCRLNEMCGHFKAMFCAIIRSFKQKLKKWPGFKYLARVSVISLHFGYLRPIN